MFNAVEYINTPRWQKVSLGLDRTKLLLKLLGNPQDRCKFVHVAGTNGKGSTCAFLESILRVAGFKTGLFTSPYLMCFEDRIRVSNANISKPALTQVTLEVKEAAEKVEEELGEHPTEFELMTAVAFKHFANEGCDVVVCEVGLGGRLDSTNVITPEVSVITHIGLDHMAILGDTIEEIALEKAGIIKPNVPIVLAPQEDCVYPIVDEVAKNLNAPLVALRTKSDFNGKSSTSLFSLSQSKTEIPIVESPTNPYSLIPNPSSDSSASNPYSLVPNPSQPQFSSLNDLQMKGDYQLENATVASAVAQLLGVDDEVISDGSRKATWPGRFEIFEGDELPCKVIVDGAHNVDGAIALRKSLEPYDSAKIAVFGALKDKDVAGIIKEVGDLFSHFFVYRIDSPRAMNVDELASLTSKFTVTKKASSAEVALVQALDFAKKEGHQNLIVCFGSLYSIGDIRRYLLKRASN